MTTPKLNDLQLILLATTVQHDDGSILPPPDHLDDQAARIRKAIPLLLRRKLIEEMPVTDPSHAWREENEQSIGLAITAAGHAIIAAEEEEEEEEEPTKPDSTPEPASLPRPGTKTAVLKMLRRKNGATLDELARVDKRLQP